ncbi:hypothetical protein ACFXPI_07780 [Streptomyces sp. NPDC059104]|uniref:hypothetical protein n=1 Tax=Streptomyces sp. NPDC059104 TaxID=3346729 RepID=UPI003697FAA9
MSFEHPAERHGDGRIGRFGKLDAIASNFTSSAAFSVQQKLDAIAAALLEQQRGEPGRAARRLREAIGAQDEV